MLQMITALCVCQDTLYECKDTASRGIINIDTDKVNLAPRSSFLGGL